MDIKATGCFLSDLRKNDRNCASDIDKFFEDVADLEEAGIGYSIWVDSTHEIVTLGVDVYQYEGKIEDQEFNPSELKQFLLD